MKNYAQWCLFIVLIGSHCTEETSDIRKPPKIIKSPNRMETFREKGSVKLECKAEGIPGVEYEWRKDGVDLNLNLPTIRKEADGTITINTLTMADEGFYQCVARNQHGKAMSDMAQLRKAFLDTNPGSPMDVPATEGQPFQLPTNPPKSFPRPTFSWEIATGIADPRPEPFRTSKARQIDDDGNLHFACAERSDALGNSIYKSTSFNSITDERKGNNYVRVRIAQVSGTNPTPPQLEFSTGNETIALVGKPLILRCFFSGCPVPTVTWESAVRASLERIIDKDATEFKSKSNVTMAHEGIYRCSGQNSVTKTTHTISVRVEAEPKFDKESDAPRDIIITEGESVTINCIASAIPEADVAWFKNGQRLNRDSLPPKFSLVNGGKSLMIRDVCRDCHEPDLVVIQCNASNVHGYAFASGYVNVLKRTTVTVSSKSGDLNVSVEMGKENMFEFSCAVQYDPITVVQPQWHKLTEKGYTVSLPSETYPDATLNGNALTIRVTPSLNESKWQIYLGEYFCVGDNNYTKDSKPAVLSYNGPLPEPPPPDPRIMLLIIVSAAVLVFILLLLIIICCCWYWRGEVYEVDKMEVKTDRDLKQELMDADFQEFWRAGKQDRKCSNASQLSFGRMTPTDGTSLNEYNFDDVGQFAEDGSFVGNYKDMVA